jgi:quercetin dioxygenase-like cupin family protein
VTRHHLVAAMVGGFWLALVCSTTLQVHAKDSTSSAVTVTMLAQGPVKALPAGKIFVNILEFRQLPGADFGPHAHIPALVYTLQGTSTIAFPGAPSLSVGPGEAAFIPAQATHTHENVDGRPGATAIALGLIIVVILVCAATLMRGRSRQVTVAVLSLLVIGVGALPLIGATSNDYYLIAVRPDSQRTLPMPRPDGHVQYSSPDFDPVPAGPYVETLSSMSMAAGARYAAPVPSGPRMVVVMEGNATVQVNDQTTDLSAGGGAFAQAGQTLTIVNSGSANLRVIDFTIKPAPPPSP